MHHSFYDCLYLALAERLDEPLVTADERFVAKLAMHDFSTRAMLLSNVTI